MTGDGPRAIFAGAVEWLREARVLLPAVSTLTRLVARARSEAEGRLWETLARPLAPAQPEALERLLEVPERARVSGLRRWRKGPAEPSGKSPRLALGRVAEIHRLGIDAAEARALVPARRVAHLARYPVRIQGPG
jgi:hypothetical protein